MGVWCVEYTGDAGLEAQLYKKIAHRDAHVLMAWTVYLCNGDDDMLVKAFEDRFLIVPNLLLRE